MRAGSGAVFGAVVGFLGLATYQSVGFVLAVIALVVSFVALWRSGQRDQEVKEWKEARAIDLEQRAASLSEELKNDLRED